MKKLRFIGGGFGVMMLFFLFGPKFAHAQTYVPKVGDLIRTVSDPTVFLVDDQLNRIPVSADAYKIRYNNNFSLVKFVDPSQIGFFNPSGGLDSLVADPNGSLIIYTTNNPTIYLLQNGFKRPFATFEAFVRSGLSNKPVRWVGTYDDYPTGSIIN
jgi:hypothetical protein